MRYNFQALPGADRRYRSAFGRLGRPVRLVVRWQVAATVAMTLIAGLLAGGNAAVSAAAGGTASVFAGLAAAWMASRSDAKSAGGVLLGALRAEAVKVGLALFLLWLVLVNFDGVVVAALVASFAVTILIFSMAFFVREH
jgi:ATP synthase protein I